MASSSAEARERNARWLGMAVAGAAMTAAWFAIGWPAPGASAGLGLLAYLFARGPRKGEGERT